jgi:hypothetical protein
VTWAQFLFLAVVLLVAGTAAWRNITAAALVMIYLIVQAAYLSSGVLTSVELLALDMVVIAFIYMKAPYRPCFPYRSLAHQFACLWLERSPCDRFIMILFPAAWYFYFVDVSASAQWWALYWTSLAQFLAAGFEPYLNIRSSREANAGSEDAPEPPAEGGAEFALASGG